MSLLNSNKRILCRHFSNAFSKQLALFENQKSRAFKGEIDIFTSGAKIEASHLENSGFRS